MVRKVVFSSCRPLKEHFLNFVKEAFYLSLENFWVGGGDGVGDGGEVRD